MTHCNLQTARDLRRNLTPAERKLWRALRALNASPATHFRRQAPIGRYIADFCEHTRKLVIEIDGGQHNEPDGLARDAKRTDWLASQDYRVIRFSNTEVLTNLEGVMISIMTAAEILPDDSSVVVWPPPTPTLPHKGGGSRIASKFGSRRQSSKRAISSRERDLPTLTTMVNPNVPSPLVGEGQGGGAGEHDVRVSGDATP